MSLHTYARGRIREGSRSDLIAYLIRNRYVS